MKVMKHVPIELSEDQYREVLNLIEHFLSNTVVWACGSRVKMTSRPSSDLDPVVFSTPQQSRAVDDLREGFEESLLPFRVDLFEWDRIPESFQRYISCFRRVHEHAGIE